MSSTDRRRTVSVWALMGPPWVSGASVRRGGSFVHQRDDPVQQAVRDLALREQRQLVARTRPRPRMTTRLVSVPKPEPGSLTSFATSRSAPLRRSFSGARSSEPVSAANPTMTGRGSRSRARAPTSARMSSVGSSWRVRPSPRASFVDAVVTGRKSATAAAMTSASAPRSRTGGEHGVAHLGGALGVDDGGGLGQRHLDPARDDRHAGPAREGRLGDRDTHPAGAPVADEPDGVDRLRRAAGADDDVAAVEVGLAERGDERRPRRRRPAGGRAPRRWPRPPHRRSAAAPRAGPHPPGPRRGCRTRAGPSRSRSRAGAARRCRGSRGASTCRRPSPARTRPAPRSRGRWP